MSFGFSIGDFVLLTQLACRTIQNARSACGAHGDLTREVSSLHMVLQRVETEVSNPHSILNQPGDGRRAELDKLATHCRKVLNVLGNILEKYNALSEEKKKVTKLWKKIQFGNGEVQDLSKIRLELATHTQNLSLFLNLLSIGSQGKVERYMETHSEELREIKSSLHWVTASMQASSHEEKSILTTYAEDDKAFWKALRRELIREGYSSKTLAKYRKTIKEYVIELGERGVLDEIENKNVGNEQRVRESELISSATSQVDGENESDSDRDKTQDDPENTGIATPKVDEGNESDGELETTHEEPEPCRSVMSKISVEDKSGSRLNKTKEERSPISSPKIEANFSQAPSEDTQSRGVHGWDLNNHDNLYDASSGDDEPPSYHRIANVTARQSEDSNRPSKDSTRCKEEQKLKPEAIKSQPDIPLSNPSNQVCETTKGACSSSRSSNEESISRTEEGRSRVLRNCGHAEERKPEEFEKREMPLTFVENPFADNISLYNPSHNAPPTPHNAAQEPHITDAKDEGSLKRPQPDVPHNAPPTPRHSTPKPSVTNADDECFIREIQPGVAQVQHENKRRVAALPRPASGDQIIEVATPILGHGANANSFWKQLEERRAALKLSSLMLNTLRSSIPVTEDQKDPEARCDDHTGGEKFSPEVIEFSGALAMMSGALSWEQPSSKGSPPDGTAKRTTTPELINPSFSDDDCTSQSSPRIPNSDPRPEPPTLGNASDTSEGSDIYTELCPEAHTWYSEKVRRKWEYPLDRIQLDISTAELTLTKIGDSRDKLVVVHYLQEMRGLYKRFCDLHDNVVNEAWCMEDAGRYEWYNRMMLRSQDSKRLFWDFSTWNDDFNDKCVKILYKYQR